MKQFNNEIGFTLIELLVVVSILGFLTATVLGYSRTAERYILLSREQSKVVTTVQRAKALALGTFGDANVPTIKAINNTGIISGQPKIRPKAPTSLKSPQPIALPRVTIIIAPKRAIAKSAAKKWLIHILLISPKSNA